MKNAAQYYIGDNQNPAAIPTKNFAQTVGQVCRLDAKTQRCKRDTEGQTESSSHNDAANGFLRCSFLPKLKETQTVRTSVKPEKTERNFYQSLSQLAGNYGIEPMQTRHFEYPYNIALAIWNASEKLQQSVLSFQEICLIQDSGKTYLISEERCNTGTALYYIPVEPLYQMLYDPKRKRNAQLIISVCSYLYHIAGIPYFRQEGSYLYWMYEMHKDWVEQDDETDETEVYKHQFRKAELIGDNIAQRIFNRVNLQIFEQRLNSFKSCDAFDNDCRELACSAFALYTEYPQASIFRNAPIHKDPECDGEEYETIGMEKYISFISHVRGWLYESIADSVNNEFNEYGSIDEPTIYKHFDGSRITTDNLDFENRLFALLDDLCSLLYNYETTRK